MADIMLHRDSEVSRTVVPNYFIDAYMLHANGEYVKVYLYLLRCMNDPTMSFSVSDAADKFEHTEKDVIRALKYWEKMHLLRLEFDENKELTGICFLDTASMPAITTPVHSTKAVPKLPPHENYSAEQLRQFKEETDVAELLFVAEHYLGHTLNSTEMNAIIYWKDALHFSNDLIEHLIDSCVMKGHGNVRYMEKVALSWATDGISTVEAAKEAEENRNELHTAIRKAFGISGRDFVPYEKKYISTWQGYGFDVNIISAACDRTMHTIHQASFEYADKILKNWKKSKVSSLADIEALDARHQSKSAAAAKRTKTSGSSTASTRGGDFLQRTYNTSELEKELLDYGSHK